MDTDNGITKLTNYTQINSTPIAVIRAIYFNNDASQWRVFRMRLFFIAQIQ